MEQSEQKELFIADHDPIMKSQKTSVTVESSINFDKEKEKENKQIIIHTLEDKTG